MRNSSPTTNSSDADRSPSEEALDPLAEATPCEVGENVKQPFDLVPEIGTRWRWYDIPYRFLDWLLNSWVRRIMPSAARRLLYRGMSFLMAFNEHERDKVEPFGGPMSDLVIPDQMQLRQGGVWTVELFPPSQYKALERSLQQNGWGRASFLSLDESNDKQVKRAREGRGFAWSQIGYIVRSNSKYIFPDAKREDLPDEFECIELTAVQLGTSVTALVAFFRLSELGELSLDRVWRGTHEPTLTWRGFHRPIVTGRYFAAIEATQRERMRIHDLARTWLSQRCPGFFASRSDGHPILDLNLFDGFDPFVEEDRKSSRDALRALGMGTLAFDRYRYVSPQMKGSVLIPTDRIRGPHEPLRNCWAIAGEHYRIEGENQRPYYSGKPYTSGMLGHIFNDAARMFILHLAVMAYLSEQRAIYSASRDLASTRHKRFTARRARKLSAELLESGLDLPAVARDSRCLWSEPWFRNIEVQSVPTELSRTNCEPFDLIESLGKQRDTRFQQLLEEDESYRAVLSTAAALGASADAARTGRIALAVSAGSMIVATITLLVTQTGDASLWSGLAKWMGWD